MVGYIARDANGSLWFHKEVPEYNVPFKAWMSDEFMELKNDEFPEFKTLCYRDNPIKVELTIRKL